MKNLLQFRTYLLMLLFATFLVSSCDKDDEQSVYDGVEDSKTIVETAQETDDLSSLVSALAKADENEDSDLIGTLNGNGAFTVFAPTNEAFTDLLENLDGFGSLDDFDTDEERALLATILQYHVVAGVAAASGDLSDGQTITTVQGEDLTINLNNGVFIDDATDNDAEVVLPNVSASNGIVHVINKVLLPQAIIDALNTTGTLVDIVVGTEALSSLEAAVIKADLVDTLNGEGPFTVFAPTYDAFEALLMALGDDYMSLDDFDTPDEIELLKNILLYHVVPAKVLEADLAAGDVATAFPENSLSVIDEDGTFVIGDASDSNASITGTDILASNGVAHTINKVLLPQAAVDFVASLQLKNIVEIAIETDDLSLLVEALQAANAGLVETLSGDGPFTVFAPTNEAFGALLDALGDDYNSLSDFDTQEEIDLLVAILTYHVVPDIAAFSTDLSDGQHILTVQGDNLGISLKDDYVHVVDASDENAKVVLPNVKASNGVVHVINKVLLPQVAIDFVASLQLKNIVEIAIETNDLSLLVKALQTANAGLVETLSGDGPFTVFAPTNQAFKDLLDFLGFHGLSDFDTDEEIAILVKVLTYHVVSGTAAFSTDLYDGQHITTVQGGNVGVNIKNGTVHITDATDKNATVVLPNVEASNGVVHVINKVLLPQEVLDILFPPTPNIVELAQSVDDLSLLVNALIQADAGLVEVLSGDGPFTVFAPTNKAFTDLLHALGDEYNSLDDFDTEAEKELLSKILAYHVVSGSAVASSDIHNHQEFHTVQGESLFAIINHGIFIRDKTHVDAKVKGPDNEASNGIVHVINKVLLPQEVLDALH
ncbi:fasciclin domain-containing protein [Flagellimonas pacifica]|uniref:Uncaracterized surface protein containing fasciclin (FAS1) repeats n=1 Tax=Flagellimonas pacifica TaxID=1247520 RepID=A0A285MS86_9FLAO|nr:fasciclin domain-containing protein [Allomuricauda parva]SNY99397.1 Uncaracterized surface protein containing fasciclin (FAS1) repeats [Allomuricauda parva]